MSVEVMSWALRVPLGGNAKIVLLGLANHAGADGLNARPMVETLAEYAHCDRRTVQRHLRQLAKDGWIEQTGMHPVGGRRDRAVVVYRLAVSRNGAAGLHERGGTDVASSDERGGSGDANGAAELHERGGTSVANGAAPVPPEPSLRTVHEPSVEPSSEKRGDHAHDSDTLPDDFPDELKPHARVVFRVLKAVAEQHRGRAVKPLALGRVMMARQRKPFVKAAYDLAAWAADPPRPVKDVVATYRSWLDRERDLAAVERIGFEEQRKAGGEPRKRRFDRRVIRDERLG